METHAYSIPLGPRWPGLLSHPHGLSRLGSQGWAVPKLQTQAGPPIATASLQHPKTDGRSGPEELWTVTLWCLLVVGFPLPASLLRVLPPIYGKKQSTFPGLRFDWKAKGKEDEVVRYKPLGVSQALCTQIYNPGTHLSFTKALITQSWSEEMFPSCGHC